ncbi:MAG: cupin domain-containing protein [Pseudomonadales bacterium]
MKQTEPLLIDTTGTTLTSCPPERAKPARDWPPVTITGAMIDREIERLADLPRPANGRRQVMFVHPSAPDPGRGLTPGVQVTLDVLLPGEETVPLRRNATEVNFCIRGAGSAFVGDRRIDYRCHDAWNHPAWATYRHRNDTGELHARLTYSNAALLEMMRVHMVEEDPSGPTPPAPERAASTTPRSSALETFTVGEDGAALMPYETLINPPSVPSRALHWPWQTVKGHLDRLEALGSAYVGRRLYLLYNPRTDRFNGTTPNFFATITIRPGGIVDKPHRHVSSAINYYFRGAGYSRVEGKRYEWQAGDLMVSAPGWAVHNHASYDGEPVYELTIQDQPLNIYMESLLWQEDLAHPARILGSHEGFATNRREV